MNTCVYVDSDVAVSSSGHLFYWFDFPEDFTQIRSDLPQTLKLRSELHLFVNTTSTDQNKFECPSNNYRIFSSMLFYISEFRHENELQDH